MTPQAVPKLDRMRSARLVTLVETVVLEGDGTHDSIARLVTYYHTPEGECVAHSDPGARMEEHGERLRAVPARPKPDDLEAVRP